jgi:hypothetical protein
VDKEIQKETESMIEENKKQEFKEELMNYNIKFYLTITCKLMKYK